MGRKCGIVERFIHNTPLSKAGIRSDLFGIIDIIALDTDAGIVGVQSCREKFTEHYRKITIEKRNNSLDWLKAGGKIEIWSWRKVLQKPGGKRLVWKPRIKEITIADFDATT